MESLNMLTTKRPVWIVLLGTGCGWTHAETAAPVLQSAAFLQQRDAVRSLDELRAKAAANSEALCKAADEADRKLADATDLSAGALRDSARVAAAAQKACADAHRALEESGLALRQARDRLRMLALGAEPPTHAAPSTDQKLLIEKAASAQDRVAELRKLAEAAFGLTDAASQAALEQQAKDAALGAESARLARQAIRSGIETRRETSAAQMAANRLVLAALDIARCASSDSQCTDALREQAPARAAAALASLDASEVKAKAASVAMKAAVWGVSAETSNAEARERYIRFQTLLDGNQNAKDLFGKDAFGLTATQDGSTVSFRWTWGTSGVGTRGANTLVLSTPTNKDGDTRVADGLAGATTLNLGRRLTSFTQRNPAQDTYLFREIQPLLRVGYQEMASRDPQSFDPRVQRVYPWAMGLHIAAAPFDEQGASLHVLKLERQRGFNAADVTVRCPVNTDPNARTVECRSGSFAEPTRAYRTLFSYAYRWKWGKFNATPTLNWSRENGETTTEFNLPVYLVGASLDPKDGLSGGVSLGWVKGSSPRFGLFIGGPLTSLFTRDWGTLSD